MNAVFLTVRLASVAVTAIVGLHASKAGAAALGLYSTVDCSSCDLSLQEFEIGTVYVRFQPEGWANEGLTGAVLRVEGLPTGWVASVQANPQATVVSGDLLASGASISFAAFIPTGCVDLFTLQLIATSTVQDAMMRVTSHTTPICPQRACPVVHYTCGPACDPDPCGLCVRGGTLRINSSQTCEVAVGPRSWSTIKSLYKEPGP
jgi:hypothetical protein